eukprot:806415-Alexandrium_andersonii.AAC.1
MPGHKYAGKRAYISIGEALQSSTFNLNPKCKTHCLFTQLPDFGSCLFKQPQESASARKHA